MQAPQLLLGGGGAAGGAGDAPGTGTLPVPAGARRSALGVPERAGPAPPRLLSPNSAPPAPSGRFHPAEPRADPELPADRGGGQWPRGGRGSALHAGPRQDWHHAGVLPVQGAAPGRRRCHPRDPAPPTRLHRDLGAGAGRAALLPAPRVGATLARVSPPTTGVSSPPNVPSCGSPVAFVPPQRWRGDLRACVASMGLGTSKCQACPAPSVPSCIKGLA
ncbi:hypothetical protein RLOC_00006970, partial [Lonchura striata]